MNWETEHYNSVLEITVSFLGIHTWEPDIYFGFSWALYLQCGRYTMWLTSAVHASYENITKHFVSLNLFFSFPTFLVTVRKPNKTRIFPGLKVQPWRSRYKITLLPLNIF
jgi:hypothetical protein